MPEPVPHRSEAPPARRKEQRLVIIGIVIGTLLTIAFVAALVIHFMLLRTDRLNWLEAPKRSSLTAMPKTS